MGAVTGGAGRPPTAEELLRLRRPAEAQVSSDGSAVAFTVTTSWSEPGRPPESRIWLAQDGGTHEATRGPHDLRPRWSPHGDALVFASSAGVDGTEIRLVGRGESIATVPGAVEDLRWSDGGASLLALVEADGGPPPDADPRVHRPSGQSRVLYRLAVDTGELEVVGPRDLTIWEVAAVGDDRAVALVSEDPTESGWYAAFAVLLDLEARTAARLYTPARQLESLRVSPAGDRIAFVEGIGSDRRSLCGTVTLCDLAGGEPVRLVTEVDVGDLHWLDDHSLLCSGWRGLRSACGVLSLDGTWREIWCGDASLGHPGGVLSVDAAGTIAVAVKQSLDEPPEVAAFDLQDGGRGWRNLSDLNGQLAELELPHWTRLTWTAVDGLEIEGLLARPQPGQDGPLPLVVLVHGGPSGRFGFQFLHPYGHPVLLAARGYAALLPNPRGSSGRGQMFAAGGVGDIGGRELGDILAGVDACIAAGIADPDRIGISGGSHGGYMAAWAVTQSDRFAASVPWASVGNLLSAHYGSSIAGFDDVFMGMRPHESAELYVERSPVVHAHRCTTPVLIVHGERDPFCPVGQAEELFNALAAAGVDVELVVYPREGHGWSERAHVLDFWERYSAFLDRHLRPQTALVDKPGVRKEHSSQES